MEQKVAEETQKGNDVLVSLVFDEVSIRKKIEWANEKFTGYVDLGKHWRLFINILMMLV